MKVDFLSHLELCYNTSLLTSEFQRGVLFIDPIEKSRIVKEEDEVLKPYEPIPEFYVLKEGEEVYFIEKYRKKIEENKIYIYNLSSVLPVLNLIFYLKKEKNITSGEEAKVFDCCAAPGGKTLLIKKLFPKSLLWAAEYSVKRLKKTKSFFQSIDLDVFVLNLDSRFSHRKFSDFFDACLVDAPCSSDEHIAKKGIISSHSTKTSKNIASRQKSLLYSAIMSVKKKGGIVVYATCTGSIFENEDVVLHTLKKFGKEIQLLSAQNFGIKTHPGIHFKEGVPTDVLKKTLRTKPDDHLSPSFVAVFKRGC